MECEIPADRVDTVFKEYNQLLVHGSQHDLQLGTTGTARAVVRCKFDDSEWDIFHVENIRRKHAEHGIIESLKRRQPLEDGDGQAEARASIRRKVQVQIYMTCSPCSVVRYGGHTCTQALVDFKKRANLDLEMEIIFAALGGIRRKSCSDDLKKCSEHYDFISVYDDEANREGLKTMYSEGIHLRTFGEDDWITLANLLKSVLTLTPSKERRTEDKRMSGDLNEILGRDEDSAVADLVRRVPTLAATRGRRKGNKKTSKDAEDDSQRKDSVSRTTDGNTSSPTVQRDMRKNEEMLSVTIARLRRELTKRDQEIKSLKQGIAVHTHTNEAFEREVQIITQTEWNRDQMIENLQQEMQQHQNMHENYKKEVEAAAWTEIQNRNQTISTLQTKAEELNKTLEFMKAENASCVQNIQMLQGEVQNRDHFIQQIQKRNHDREVSSLGLQVGDLNLGGVNAGNTTSTQTVRAPQAASREIQDRNREVAALRMKVEILNKELAIRKAEVDRHTQTIRMLKDKNRSTANEAKKSEDTIRLLKTELTSARNQRSPSALTASDYERQISAQRSEIRSLKSELKDSQNFLKEAKKSEDMVRRLTSELTSVREHRSQTVPDVSYYESQISAQTSQIRNLKSELKYSENLLKEVMDQRSARTPPVVHEVERQTPVSFGDPLRYLAAARVETSYHCNCKKTACSNNRCGCRQRGQSCNSHCHPNSFYCYN